MVDHPAKFSDSILDALREIAKGRIKPGEKILDPFAGVGKIHLLADEMEWQSLGVEIEPEWAREHARTVCGDSTKLTHMFRRGEFVAVITSPTYGSRMSDHHNAKERCKPCDGSGTKLDIDGETIDCEKCGGVGRRSYKRNTYKHTLARINPDTGEVDDLHPNNTGAMPFIEDRECAYKTLHRQVWGQVAEIGPMWIFLNVSNFIRGKNPDGSDHEVDVTAWHLQELGLLGYEVVEHMKVDTPRNGHGAHRERRVAFESVYALGRTVSL